jgi:hypothetical protein
LRGFFLARQLLLRFFFKRIIPVEYAPNGWGVKAEERMRASGCVMQSLESRLCMSETLSGAIPLGVSPTHKAVGATLNNANRDDIYFFHFNAASTIYLRLNGLSDNATLQLIADNNHNDRYDSGETVASASVLGASTESVSHLLDAGSYFVRVAQTYVGGKTPYNLHADSVLFTTPDQRDTAGNTMAQAMPIAPTKNVFTYVEYIGGTDPADWYRRNITSEISASIRLDGLVYDADLTLYYDRNNNGKIDAGETVGTTVGEGFTQKDLLGNLSPGSYYIEITPKLMQQPTTYALRITPADSTTLLPDLT